MFPNKYPIFILLLCISLFSCTITERIGTVQIETMKPGIVNIPDHTDTVAILNRDLYHSDTAVVEYFNNLKFIKDSAIHYNELSNAAIDALEKKLKEDGYFLKVYNFHDSLKYIWSDNKNLVQPEELFKKTKSNLCVFLDYIRFYQNMISKQSDYSFISGLLSWTMVFREDSVAYFYNQIDTLQYDYAQTAELMKGNNPKPLFKNAAEYLGQSFGKKLIPGWLTVDRMYYKSGNPMMLKAEKLALNNDWIGAAEIWNQMTRNKNEVMAAKACYNLALACEMEGKPDLAIDWLVHSYRKLTKNNVEHRQNCQRYINILVMRKKEIEQLGRQIRNPISIKSE